MYQLDGGSGEDRIDGGRGNDVITGGSGDDTITGGRGADTLQGGAGNDHLTGGPSADTFVFGLLAGGGSLGLDVIQDFRTGQDSIQISQGLNASLAEADGFTAMTLSADDGTLIGMVQIFGTDVEESEDLFFV